MLVTILRTLIPLRSGVALVALLAVIAVGLLSGPAGFRTEPRSAEATLLSEVKKLLASDAEANDIFGVSVAISGDTAVVGASGEGAGGVTAGAAYVFERNQGGAGNWGAVKKLTASDAQPGDVFGISVAVNGDTAVVGARHEDAEGNNAGAAYVFERDQGGAGNWGEMKKLTASDANVSDLFGRSVAVSGLTAVVGAHAEVVWSGSDAAGAAYVFQRDQGGAGNWGEVTKLTASDAKTGDFFGTSVAISGDTAAVGARGKDTEGDAAGAAYVFQRDQGGADNWGQVQKLRALDTQAGDWFGFKVAVSGDTAVVGALSEDAGGTDAGAAYVFQRDQGGTDNWGEMKKLTASDAQADDRFGTSVAISGVTAVVGAYREESEGFDINFDAGAAYLFQRDQGGADNWGEVTKLTASDAEAVDWFGFSAAVSGNSAAVGAYREDAGGNQAGATYVFEQPLSGDADHDGCSNLQEQKAKSAAGTSGGRDPNYIWDVFDTDTENGLNAGTALTGTVTIGDIFAVAGHFGDTGDSGIDPLSDASGAGYHTRFDRGDIIGPNDWNRAPADGAVTIDDIFAVAAQFGLDC